MTLAPIPTRFFVLAAVRLGQRWLLVHETKHGQRWYLPAGKVEPGETFVNAAKRETLEEAGIPIEIDGVVRIEHSPQANEMTRVRIILLAHPSDNTQPKSKPDQESLEAGWFSLEEIRKLPLRGEEVIDLFKYLSGQPAIAPLTILTEEGAPYIT